MFQDKGLVTVSYLVYAAVIFLFLGNLCAVISSCYITIEMQPKKKRKKISRIKSDIDASLVFSFWTVQVWSAPNYCYRCGNVASILSFNENMVLNMLLKFLASPLLLFIFYLFYFVVVAVLVIYFGCGAKGSVLLQVGKRYFSFL